VRGKQDELCDDAKARLMAAIDSANRDCGNSAKRSVSNYYHDDPTISRVVASLMASMDKTPFDRDGKPCSTIEEMRHVVAHHYGKRAGKSVRSTVH